MATKKKTAKKTGKALAKQGRFNGPMCAKLAQARHNVSLPDALKGFDAALSKAIALRGIILPNLTDEVTANRARRLADAASNLQVAGWTLREAAYDEADK